MDVSLKTVMGLAAEKLPKNMKNILLESAENSGLSVEALKEFKDALGVSQDENLSDSIDEMRKKITAEIEAKDKLEADAVIAKAAVIESVNSDARYAAGLRENSEYSNNYRNHWSILRTQEDQNLFVMSVAMFLINIFAFSFNDNLLNQGLLAVAILGSALAMILTQIGLRHDTVLIGKVLEVRKETSELKLHLEAIEDIKAGVIEKIKKTVFCIGAAATVALALLKIFVV